MARRTAGAEMEDGSGGGGRTLCVVVSKKMCGREDGEEADKSRELIYE